MGQALHLTTEHMRENHPDHQAIRDWLEAHSIDVAWVVLPQVVRINKDAIIVWEYLYNPGGSVVLDPNTKEHMKAPVRYECTPAPLPELSTLTLIEET